MTRRLPWLVAAWPWVLALVVCAPLLAPGYVLTYDMVWVPDLALRADTVGLGSALPRAVPSDALVAVLDEVVPGQLLQKMVLVGSLGLAGTGMIRLWGRDAPVAALASSSLYVWNPFLAERLVMGQWPLLIAYAALPWLIAAAWGVRQGRPGSWPSLVLFMAAMSLSPATGLMAVVAAVSCSIDLRAAGTVRRMGAVLGLGLAVNGPWICAGLAQLSTARSDPAAVALFDAQSEGHLGRVGSLLTLGGIWNTDVVPTSRTTAAGVVGALLVLGVVLLGLLRLLRSSVRRPVWGLPVLALGALAAASSGWLVPDAIRWVASTIPAGGLLRDGTRYLALLAPLEALLFGAGVGAAGAWASRHGRRAVLSFISVAGVILPLAVLPDFAWGVGGRLSPVSYPASWYQAREIVAATDQPGDIAVVPFSAYRAPAWNFQRPVLDPAGRFFEQVTVVNDDLVVSGRVISGEDPRASQVQAALESEAHQDALASLGVGFVVDSQAEVMSVEVVAEPVAERAQSGWAVSLVALGWLLALATTGAAGAAALRRRRSTDPRRMTAPG